MSGALPGIVDRVYNRGRPCEEGKTRLRFNSSNLPSGAKRLDFDYMRNHCSKLRDQFWRRSRCRRVCRRRFGDWCWHRCWTPHTLSSWMKDRKSQGKTCKRKDCHPGDCCISYWCQWSPADRRCLCLIAPRFNLPVPLFTPTLKFRDRGRTVGMGREALDESIEGPIGKFGVIAPGIHLLSLAEWPPESPRAKRTPRLRAPRSSILRRARFFSVRRPWAANRSILSRWLDPMRSANWAFANPQRPEKWSLPRARPAPRKGSP